MAQQRIDAPSTTIQPTPGTQAVDLQAEGVLAAQQARGAATTQEVAGQVQTVATQVMRDETLKQAQRDAAQVVTVDDVEGKRGWGGFLYNDTYTKAAVAQYSSLAVTEAQAKASEVLSRNPNNPDAVRAEMTTYLDEKKKAMPAHLADAMTPHYTGILTGAVSSATAGAGRTNLASLEATSKAQLSGLILEQANTQGSAAYRNASPAERQATDAIFADKWAKIKDQMLSYMTATSIIQVEKQAGALVEANVKGEEFRQRASAMSLDPVGIAKLKEEAEKWARDPARAEHYGPTKATLDGYIDRGQNMAGAVQQAVVIDQQLKVGGIQDQVAVLDANQKDPAKKLSAQDYEAAMARIKQQALQMGVGRLPGQQAQLLAASGDSSPVLQQMYGTAMLSASGRAMYGATREIQLQGTEEVRGIITDQNVLRMAGNNLYMGGLVQQGQKILATESTAAKVPDIATLGVALQSKEMTAKDLPQVYASAVEKGLVGELPGQMSRAQFYDYARIGLAKNKEFQTDLANSTQALSRAIGSPTTHAEPLDAPAIATLQKTHPDKFYGVDEVGRPKEIPFNPNVPAHLDSGVATVVRSFHLPDAIKNWGATMSSTASAEDQKKLVGLYDRVEQVVAQKYAGLPEEIRFAKIAEATRTVMGKEATANVMAFRKTPGDPKAIDAAKADAGANMDRQATLNERDGYVRALTGGVERGYEGGQPSTASSILRGSAEFLSKFHPTAQRGVEWLQSMQMFSQHAMAAAVSTLPQFGKTPGMGTPKEGNIRIEPNAMSFIENLGSGPTGYLTLYGKAWEDQGYNKHQQALLKTLQDHSDKLSMVWQTDPKTGDHHAVLTYRDYRSEFNAVHKQAGVLPWDDAKIRDATITAYHTKMPYIVNQMNTDTVRFSTEVQGGQTLHFMSAQNKDLSKPPFRIQVRPDDPMIDRVRTDLADNLAKRTEMPSLYKFVSSVPGVALFDDFVANNRQSAMLQAASGRNGPGENWTAMIDTIRQGVEAFTDQQIKDGNTNIQRIQPADWEKLRRPDMQKTINEMGSLYAILFGPQAQLPLAGRGGTTEAAPPEPVTLGPTSTSPLTDSLELQRRAEQSRNQADPLTRSLIERSFKPPVKP